MSLTQSKGAAAFEELLKSRPTREVAWYELAEAIALAEQESSSGEAASAVRAAAVAASGYSANLIARYAATYDRIKRISGAGGPAMSDMLAPPFNTVEAAVKLYELDQQKGLEAFRRIKAGKLTLAAVRAELTDAKVRATSWDSTSSPATSLPSVKFLSKDVRRRRQSTIITSLQRGFAPLSGQYEEMTWRVKDSFLEGEGIYRIRRAASFDPSMEEHYGLETVVMASERGPRFIDTILPASIVRARFFLQYYLAFWSHEPMSQIEHAVWLLDALEEETIGVVSVGPDGRVELHREPISRANPDTVARLQQMLSLIATGGTLDTGSKTGR
jgi:hypothetical protein